MPFLKPSPPPAPDYNQLAMTQGAQNEATARLEWQLNHPNETNPYGSRTWTQDPNNQDSWSVSTTLNPVEQQKLDMQNQLITALMGGASTYAMPALFDALQTDYTPPREAQLGWENAYAPDQRLQTESGMYEAPWIQEGLDFSGAPAIPTADQATRQSVQDALYKLGAQYLDPQFERSQNALDTKLSNQGIFAGSEAYKDSQDILADQKAKAYADLRNQSIAGGGDEMARQFGMGMSAHQAGVGDITTQGQFANNARGQLVQELLSDMQARNAAIMGQGNMATAQQGASNTGTQAWLAQKAGAATLPINVVTALMSGGQVNNPQFQPYAANTSWQPAPVYQAGRDQYQSNLSGYNAQQGALGNWLNFGGNLATAAMLKP